MSTEKTKTSFPFFSIIIATYNRASLLKRAMESLISQTETDWEAIIVDDGSTDGTYDELVPYLKAYSKIKYIKKKHSGEAHTKNMGISAANGNFISFLDSDDEYAPEHLKNRRAILKSNPTIDFLHGGVRILGNQYVPDRFDHTRSIHLNDCAIGGTFFVSKKVLSVLKGFRDLPIGADADLLDRAKVLEINIMKVHQSTYIYNREIQDSITHNLCIER